MKRILISGILIIFFLFNYSNGEIKFQYNGFGLGGQASLVVSDDDGGAFGFGFHGIIKFSLGTIGIIYYNPSLCFWFNSVDKKEIQSLEYEYNNKQTSLNLFDLRYLFPVQESIFIIPYAGCGLCFIIDQTETIQKTINTGSGEINTTKSSRKDGNAGFNFFGGIDFPINDYFIPNVEIRFTATSNWSFRLTGGATLHF
ncbi:MAG: hypothetical protein PVI26_12675 [Chitinispirillia bacterium]|jgi:hypothetical protein